LMSSFSFTFQSNLSNLNLLCEFLYMPVADYCKLSCGLSFCDCWTHHDEVGQGVVVLVCWKHVES
jgi:hypothetical protein